jgi:hypothetical protein
MANLVWNTIYLVAHDKKATSQLADFDLFAMGDGESIATCHILPEWDHQDWPTRDWMETYIGSRSAYIEDGDPSYVGIVSTWTPVLPFFKCLGYHLAEICEAIPAMRYIDECYNFIGAAIFINDTVYSREQSKDWVINERSKQLKISPEDYDCSSDDGWDLFLIDTLDAWIMEMIYVNKEN